jgi:hypothetical protein
MEPTATPRTDDHPAQEEDRVEVTKLIVIGVVALIVFTVGVLWSWAILRARRPDLRGPGSTAGATQIGRREIGIVDQIPFASRTDPEVGRAAARRKLNGYGWVDRRRGIIRVPIERAIDHMVGGRGGAP